MATLSQARQPKACILADGASQAPLPCASWRLLHRGTVGELSAVVCHAPASGPGSVEVVLADHFVLQRNGVYVKHHRGVTAVGDTHHAVMFNRDEEYRVSHPADGGDECTVLTPAPAALDELVGRSRRAGVRRAAAFPVQDVRVSAHDFFLHHLLVEGLTDSSSDPEPVEFEERLWSLAFRLVQRAQAEGRVARDPAPSAVAALRPVVDRVKEHLAVHYRTRLTLDDIAGQTGYSPFYLSRAFTRLVGVPIYRYLIQLRLRSALGRLPDMAGSLSQVALSVGFSSHSHFTDAFHRTFGVTPSAVASQRSRQDLTTRAAKLPQPRD